MGYAGKLSERLKAQELRGRGYSYSEIRKVLSVSKDTLSRWCRDIVLTPQQEARLICSKANGQKKGSIIAAAKKRQERLDLIVRLNLESKKTLGKLSERDKFIAGIALYAGEGDKTDGKGGFTNTNPYLIKFMKDWFVNFAKVEPSRLRGALWIHDDLDANLARSYWSSLTGIPLEKFHKTYIAKCKGDSGKIRKNIHEYGVFSIRFSDSNKQRQIMGWISALLGVK